LLDRLLLWDRETFLYLNSLGVEDYDIFWSVATNINTWIPLFLLFLILVIAKFPKKEASFITTTILLLLGFVLLVMNLTKDFVERLRPNNNAEINTVIRILKSPEGYSFFSGHAATSFAITTLIVLFLRKKIRWVWIFYLWPLVFSFSRIYVGVHYPSDIVAGAFFGLLSAFLFYALYKRFIVPYLLLTRPL
jgi:undecaprenyl-diphosphatase